MAYDVLKESIALIESRRVEPVHTLSRRHRFAALAVDVSGHVAATMFARRGVGCIWEETHVLAPRDGQWTWLGGGGGGGHEQLLADRPAELRESPLRGQNSVTVSNPRVLTATSSGGVLDDGDQAGASPSTGRWISYSVRQASAQVALVEASDRTLTVPWHGQLVLVWADEQPPHVVARDERRLALGTVLFFDAPD